MFGQIRRYIRAHLTEDDLSPESVLAAFQCHRPTLYRLFQHEGGVGENAGIIFPRLECLMREIDGLAAVCLWLFDPAFAD